MNRGVGGSGGRSFDFELLTPSPRSGGGYSTKKQTNKRAKLP